MSQEITKQTKTVKAGEVTIGGNNPLCLIAGPCVIENEAHCLAAARRLKEIADKEQIPLVFKASYDKANRSSINSFRGPGLQKGLKILAKVKEKFGLPLLTDVHCRADIKAVAKIVDIIQVPAFLSRQTDMLADAARSGRVVNVKKGQFLAPWDMKQVVAKIEQSGCEDIILTERGVSFGYNNLVSDMRSLVIMRDLGYPVMFDATHSVQLPGGQGTCSGGDRRFVQSLSRAAVAVGCDALFLEVHEDPEKALCDGPNSLPVSALPDLITLIKNIDMVVKSH